MCHDMGKLQYLSIWPYTPEYTALYLEYTAVYWVHLFAPCGCFNLKNSIVGRVPVSGVEGVGWGGL